MVSHGHGAYSGNVVYRTGKREFRDSDEGSGIEDGEESEEVRRWQSYVSDDMDSESCCAPQYVGACLCLTFCIGLAAAIFYYGPVTVLGNLLKMLPKEPGWDWFIGYAIATTLSIVMMMPIWPPLCMASGLLFGLAWGVLLNILAIWSAAMLSLFLGSLCFREPVRRKIERSNYSRIKKMMLVLEDSSDSLMFLILFRFLWIPMFIRNYAPATLEVPAWRHAVAAVPHTVWISIVFASVGSTFENMTQVAKHGRRFKFRWLRWHEWIIFVVALLMTIILGCYAQRKYAEHVKAEQEELRQSDSDAACSSKRSA